VRGVCEGRVRESVGNGGNDEKRIEEAEAALVSELKMQVRQAIGPFATPEAIIIASCGLPKTRSGKIMRRILRKIACGEHSPEQLGDISTLAEPGVVEGLIKKVTHLLKSAH